MRFIKILVGCTSVLLSSSLVAGSHYASGKITSLLASATDPAIRLTGNISPDNCDAGVYGWIAFSGSAEERNIVYSSALALSLSGKKVTIYTNNDGKRCRITNIQVTSGLN